MATNDIKGIRVGILGAVFIVILTQLGLFDNLLQRLEYWALDYRFHLASKSIGNSKIVIITIDDKSIQRLGPWPWPRSYHAKLIDILTQAKAKVIGLDIIFSTPNRKEDQRLVEAIKKAKNVIIAAYPMIPTQISFTRNILTVEHIQIPIKEMAKVAKGIGHIAVVYDKDGIVRRVPALLKTKDKTLLAFGIEVALACKKEKQRKIAFDSNSLQVNSIKIPLDSEGNMLINYIGGPHSFTEIPYYRVIKGEIPADFFKDKIVLVGVTASGLSNTWATPFINQGEMHSIELHANVIHTILNKRFFIHLGKKQSIFFILFLGIISGFIFYRFPRLGKFFLIFTILFITLVSVYLFLKKRILLETIPLLSVLFATYVPITFIKSREYRLEMWKRDLEISTMCKVGKVIRDSKDDTEVLLRSICQLIKKLIKADVCCAIIKRGDAEIIIDGNGQSRPLINQQIVQRALQRGEPILTDQLPKAKGVLCVPIKSINHIYGALFLERNKVFETRDTQVVSIFSDYIAFTIERSNMLHKIQEAYIQTIHALAKVIDVKYPYVHEHSSQVSKLAVKIANILKLPEAEIEAIKYAAILHDLGMIGIPEDILYKSNPLTSEERFYLESHPETSIEVIKPITFLKMAIPIIKHHHERYDGKGYPDGLAGDEIPLGSQILAVADSFVAMLADRPYRKALTQEEAISEIKRQSGTQFNPRVVKALLQSLKELEIDANTKIPS